MYLLDTSILSEPLRRRPNPQCMEHLQGVPPDALFTSTVCVMEMRYGSARRGDADLWRRIQREILAHIQILPFGKAEALVAGDLLAHLQRTGQTIGVEDVQIAATALVGDLTVVTVNESHFTRVSDLRIVSWMR